MVVVAVVDVAAVADEDEDEDEDEAAIAPEVALLSSPGQIISPSSLYSSSSSSSLPRLLSLFGCDMSLD